MAYTGRQVPDRNHRHIARRQDVHRSKGLKEILRDRSDEFVHNVTVKMFTYSLGRGLEPSDDPTVDAIGRDVKSSVRFSSLVLDVVKSRQFQMRSMEIAKK